MIPTLAVIFAVGFVVGAAWAWQAHYAAPERDEWRLPGRRRDLLEPECQAIFLATIHRREERTGKPWIE